MEFEIRKYTQQDLAQMIDIWNEVVDAGNAFSQTNHLSEENAADFFCSQTFTGVAENQITGEILGLYILHPNNIGRCGHLANASYAVRKNARGKHIGSRLISHSLQQAKDCGFRIMQFNAVVRSNDCAIKLYEQFGFTRLGVIPKGFLLKDEKYDDIILYYKTL
jgi:L-amino acid N-acyltransferase YncA